MSIRSRSVAHQKVARAGRCQAGQSVCPIDCTGAAARGLLSKCLRAAPRAFALVSTALDPYNPRASTAHEGGGFDGDRYDALRWAERRSGAWPNHGWIMAKKILLDIDPGIDDAVALCLALFDPQVEVVAVT